MGRCDIVIAAEGIYSLEVKSGDGLADSTLDRIRKIGTYLRGCLDNGKTLFEEILGSEIILTTLCGLFGC